MNGQWNSSKTTWLRFQLRTDDSTEEFVWIDLSQLVAIRECTSLDQRKLSLLVMRDHNNWTVLGWAGDRLQEVQESQ